MIKPGDWYVICDQCARKAWASEMTTRWDGKIVHADPEEGCWETRHPQEFIRPVKDNYPLPFVRPDSEGTEGGTHIVDFQGNENTYDATFTVHSVIENGDYNSIPSGTFQTTDYDWE